MIQIGLVTRVNLILFPLTIIRVIIAEFASLLIKKWGLDRSRHIKYKKEIVAQEKQLS